MFSLAFWGRQKEKLEAHLLYQMTEPVMAIALPRFFQIYAILNDQRRIVKSDFGSLGIPFHLHGVGRGLPTLPLVTGGVDVSKVVDHFGHFCQVISCFCLYPRLFAPSLW